ncbi:fumarylacetoacetase [Marinoscillum pacificum]|uniref:fumarylacetoacetase n=1 Tax=Marinoscillum pacificum TaxID=392723 RepID=UPI0021577C3E|nr:fumarylacetoacetase [Marinoscillum pacificum]
MIEANNPSLKSWIHVKADSDFPIQNLPFGVFKKGDDSPKVASIIGDQVINLHVLLQEGFFEGIELPLDVFDQNSLNPFITTGKKMTNAVRGRLSELLRLENQELQTNNHLKEKVFIPVSEVEMLLPVKVGDYTDFYSSEQHAFNVGSMFRDPENALLPNWKHMPVGYHGRACSIVVSGTDILRPKGQTKSKEQTSPVFGPTKRLDFELEMAFIVGKSTTLGESVGTDQAEEFIFGFTLFNDWSARDIQTWEYVPLGPFLAKNFASSMSPWVVTIEAMEPFRVSGPKQEPEVLEYLSYSGDAHFDVKLEVYIEPEGEKKTKITSSNYRNVYWNIRQQLAHHTVNGCNINVGDLYASGTISGKDSNSFGSMLELSWNGTRALSLEGESQRLFVEDGDTVTVRGFGEREGVRIGFGEVTNKILKAK